MHNSGALLWFNFEKTYFQVVQGAIKVIKSQKNQHVASMQVMRSNKVLVNYFQNIGICLCNLLVLFLGCILCPFTGFSQEFSEAIGNFFALNSRYTKTVIKTNYESNNKKSRLPYKK